jgi:hypothetical protein
VLFNVPLAVMSALPIAPVVPLWVKS